MTHSGSDHHNGMQYSSFYLEWTLQDTDQLWHMQQDLLDLEHALPIPSQQQCNPSWLPFLDKQPQINPQESMDWDLKTLFDDCTPTPSQQQCDQSWSPFLDLQPQINPQGSVDWDLKTLFDDCTMSDSSQYSQPQEILAQQTVIVHYDQFIVPPSEAPENAQCPAPYLQHPADCFYDELSVAMQGPQGSQDVYQCVPPQPNIGSLEPLGHAQQQQLDLSQLQHSATSHTFHQYPDGSASQYVINTFHQQAQFIVQQQAEINQKQVLHRARKFQHQQFDQQHYMQVDAKDIEIPLVQSSSAHAEIPSRLTDPCQTSPSSFSAPLLHFSDSRLASPMSDDDPTGPGRPQSSGKRKAVQWSSKIEIFNDWKHHRNTLSMEEFARKLKKPRSSVAGFIKEVNMFLMKPIQLAIQPHACRRVQPRALILEEILAQWLRDLGSRGIPVSNKKITGQAFHIQRLLNELLIKPLHYEYSPSWINNFRKRQNITIEAMPSQPTENDKTIVAHTTMAYDLDRTDLNDIYTCDVANMFLMIDDSLHGMKQNGAVVGGNSSSVSVLLCCNATGSDRRDPFILVRQNENTPTAGKHGGAVLDAVLDDLTANHFESWLIEMDGSLDRNIKLLLDRTMWDLLHQSSKACLVPPLRSRIPLKHIEIIAASNRLGAWLPMSTRILKEFKTWYYTTLCEMELKCFGPMDKLLSHLRLIPKAWGRVHEATIRTSFNRFLNLGNPDRPSLKPDHYRDSDDHAETAFRIALSKAYPNIKKKSLNSHLTQDKDMGPSGFIRSRIYEMQSRPEFKDHFKMNTSFGGVHCVNKRPMSGKIIRFEDIQHKEKFWGEKGRPWQDEEAGLPAQAKLPYARHSHHGPAEAFSVVQVWTV